MLTNTLPPSALSALEHVEVPAEPQGEATKTSTTPSLKERILTAFDVTRSYAATLQDPETRDKIMSKLSKSGVSGSFVKGVAGVSDVVKLLESVTNWNEVQATLHDEKIIVVEGELPSDVEAVTAYASVREIEACFGAAGVATISAKIGYHKNDEFYFCTMQVIPTNILTVQLRLDEDKVETFHQFFPGRELRARFRKDDGDTIVRCGLRLPRKQLGNQMKKPHAKNNRTSWTN